MGSKMVEPRSVSTIFIETPSRPGSLHMAVTPTSPKFMIKRISRAVSDVIQFGPHNKSPVERIWNQVSDLQAFQRSNKPYVVKDTEALDLLFFATLSLGVLGALELAVRYLRTLENSYAVARNVFMGLAKANFAVWLSQHPRANGASFNAAEQVSPYNEIAEAFIRAVFSHCTKKRFYGTTSGTGSCWAQMMRPGDQVYVLGGRLSFYSST
jgi:hypothetical protein